MSGQHLGHFEKWSVEQIEASKLQETWLNKLLRNLGTLAGLKKPLNESDYQVLLKKYGSDEAIRQQFIPNNIFEVATTKVRNQNRISVDTYTLVKEGNPIFIYMSCLLYFMFISSLFSFLASILGECYEVTASNFLTKGFLLVSGIGLGIDQSDQCLLIEALGVLVGVYVSLPIIGAIVLVRLLDNTAVCFSMSNVVLLGQRAGMPIISVRTMSNTGKVYTNRNVHLFFAVGSKDPVTGEGYSESVSIEMPYLDLVQAFGMASTYRVTEDDLLLKKQVIIKNHRGHWKWNFPKLAVSWYTVTADKDMGSRSMSDTKFFVDLRHHLIDCHDESGAYPIWKSCSPSAWFGFVGSKGTTVAVSDLNLLSSWEYSPKQMKEWKEKQEAQAEAAEDQQNMEYWKESPEEPLTENRDDTDKSPGDDESGKLLQPPPKA